MQSGDAGENSMEPNDALVGFQVEVIETNRSEVLVNLG